MPEKINNSLISYPIHVKFPDYLILKYHVPMKTHPFQLVGISHKTLLIYRFLFYLLLSPPYSFWRNWAIYPVVFPFPQTGFCWLYPHGVLLFLKFPVNCGLHLEDWLYQILFFGKSTYFLWNCIMGTWNGYIICFQDIR